MPENPYDPEQLKRQAQITQLGQPTSTTMPVGGAPKLQPASDPWAKGQIVGGAREGADFARLGGGFGDANTDSMKHTFGRLAQNYAPNPQGLQGLMNDAEFKRLFPKATVNKDWIDFGGQVDPHTGTAVGKVDAIHAFDEAMGEGNNKNWQWLTEEEALGGGGSPAAAAPRPMAVLNPAGDNSTLARIMAELSATQNDEQSPAEREAILQLLQGGLI